MKGLTLDAGALIGFEKVDRRVVTMLQLALDEEAKITVPAGVLGQVWRGGPRQIRLARFLTLEHLDVEPLDARRARASGKLCGESKTRDVIDASVVVGAKIRGDAILTSDVDDLRRLDAEIELVAV